MKMIIYPVLAVLLLTCCSVQQFSVNTKTQPFENGAGMWGERTQKCGAGGWKLELRKDEDFHLLGINVKKSNVKKMVEELNATSYTIETKSNLIIYFITFGIADYKVVRVIKRLN